MGGGCFVISGMGSLNPRASQPALANWIGDGVNLGPATALIQLGEGVGFVACCDAPGVQLGKPTATSDRIDPSSPVSRLTENNRSAARKPTAPTATSTCLETVIMISAYVHTSDTQ